MNTARRRKVTASLAAVGLMFVLIHVMHPDGLDGMAWSVFLGEDTRFASDYSALGFARIRQGMDHTAVRRLVGNPLQVRIDELGGESWLYTDSPSGSNFRVRTVTFDANGIVASRYAEFYVD
jgi:hypothetical protein